jgi:hypothetical protein
MSNSHPKPKKLPGLRIGGSIEWKKSKIAPKGPLLVHLQFNQGTEPACKLVKTFIILVFISQ